MHSLSQEILEGTFEGVETLLAKGAPINVSDEYGYTPLIHATVTHRADLVTLLLKHNAEPNIVDMSGSTPLHWAVDINDLEICKILLEFGADPNAYCQNGQPVLFYPLLRKDHTLVKLLVSKGADLNFAKEFIGAKLIGHRFELQGSTDIITSSGLFLSIDLEGFYLEFTLSLIRESLERFINSYVAHRMDIHSEELKIIINSFKNASKLREYKHFSKDLVSSRPQIMPLLDIDLLLLPVSYKGHAITFVRYGDLLAKCDRGVMKMTDPIVINKITKPEIVDKEFLINLLYKKQTEKSIKVDIVNTLGLVPYAKLPIKHQITGNCSWANTEASVPTMLYMLLHEKISDSEQLDLLVKSIMKFYKTWLEWDKDRAIEDWLEGFDKLSFARQKSKAALLGAILFQACNHNKTGDLERAARILEILIRKEFHYVIRIYANLFVRRSKTAEGIAFQQLIEKCGYQLSQFNN